MKKSNNVIPLVAACLLATSAQSSQGDEGAAERAIEYRQSIMTLYSWNMKPMGAMLKGKVAFDQDLFSRHAQDLASLASLDLLAGFPEDTDEGETDARMDIWMDFEDFEAKFTQLQSAVKKLGQAVKRADEAGLKVAFGEVGKACKACHKAYKD